MRQAITLFESSQKRRLEDIRIQAKIMGVELKNSNEGPENDLSDEQEQLLERARHRALKRIREDKIGKDNI